MTQKRNNATTTEQTERKDEEKEKMEKESRDKGRTNERGNKNKTEALRRWGNRGGRPIINRG